MVSTDYLIDQNTLKKIDVEEMFKVYDRWPQIAKQYYESDFKPAMFTGIDHIVFAGMGGSGSLGDIFSSILSKTNLHVSVVKGYLLPKTVDKSTLVITTSISGNTTETLTVLETAKNLDCQIMAFSSGGKMQEFCVKNNIEYRKIPMIHSPRASFTIFLFSMLKILDSIMPIKTEDVNEAIFRLEEQQKIISSDNLTDTNPALTLAEWISGIPIVYYPWGLHAPAIRFKNSLQENAKVHVIAEDIIESCHNGIVAWEKTSNVKPILIQGEKDYFKTKENWKIVKEYFHTKNIEYKEIFSGGGSILTKLISLTYLLDFSTIYLAAKLGVDPSPVNSIDFVKNRL